MDILRTLSDHWFLTEPAFFALYCQQQLEANASMECPIRCGQGRIEYNPLLLKKKNFAEVEQLMRIEMIRLFLKHPYEREPEGCGREAMSIGSNITIADGYCMLHKEKLPLKEPGFYHLPLGQYYEWYAKKIQEQMNEEDGSRDNNNINNEKHDDQNNSPSNNQRKDDADTNDQGGTDPKESNTQLSALWREDSLQRQRINELIERTSDWGSIPADIVERIKASTNARISNRLIWQGFKSTIINSQRKLTRMRPNRRTGILHMGNAHQFTTRLLVGIDVSGSVCDAALSDFFSYVNRIFRYGTSQIDVCQFDAALGPIIPMQRASATVEVTGRGGTSFQPIIDYFEQHQEYDGLIILTDGQAPPPSCKSSNPRILWVCQDPDSYDASHQWMEQKGRCCYINH